MAKTKQISRRQFVASAVSTAAISSVPMHRLFAGIAGRRQTPDAATALTGRIKTGKIKVSRISISHLTRSCEIFRCAR
jgi:hypothetical protein